MKRGFTLIEMMVVIAVLVTLMAMTFRLANIGSDTEARTMTISRMQRLENALSGFHAAFGCYPPVKLHGNRSLESQDRTINWANEGEAWRWVREVCRAQPIGCRFPFPKGAGNSITDAIKDLSDMIREASNSEEFQDLFSSQDMKDWAAAGFMSASDSKVEGRLSGKKDKVLWSDMKLFQYGVMSFLLPRYLVMMGGDRQYYESNDGSGGYAQWSKNNQNPSDPYTGESIPWSRVYDWVQNYVNSNEQMNENVMKLRMMPSQAVCARWMPNLEGACRCNRDVTLFGVHIKSSHWIDMGIFDGMSMARLVNALRGICYSPEDSGSYTDQYILDEVTVQDGWGNEFYYYSRSPYQSYTLWSSGPDGKTFPPWISRDNLQSSARSDSAGTGEADRAAQWTKDDIIHLSN
ncbi:MAG: prepilin-type N-terminal cleavage/methylation domain-containing protein [Kiritimatiellae bacterium]|nr:prepilin-type N-terminal cleavage/methylation domain-containing protein [Kiritimatiellia bacterium]